MVLSKPAGQGIQKGMIVHPLFWPTLLQVIFWNLDYEGWEQVAPRDAV